MVIQIFSPRFLIEQFRVFYHVFDKPEEFPSVRTIHHPVVEGGRESENFSRNNLVIYNGRLFIILANDEHD